MRILIVVLFALLLLPACGPIKVYIDSDPDFEIARYGIYEWSNLHVDTSKVRSFYGTPTFDSWMKKYVDSEMNKKGYRMSEGKVKLQLHFHVILEDKKLVPTESYLYEGNALWIRNATDPYYFEQGTLIIDMVDKQTSCLIWRSRGVALIEGIAPDNLEHTLSKSVQKMLKSLPKTVEKSVSHPTLVKR
ncbi:MAG: DUF4136 domain-containing protein [Chryseolinea sp.]